MSFKATLAIGGKEFDVLRADYALARDVDHKGRPSGAIKGGRIQVTVESNEDTSMLEKMVNTPHKMLSGIITFKKSDEDAKLKELSFENAYIISFAESFSSNNNLPMQISMTFSAQTIKVGGAKHTNDWPTG